MYDTLLPGGNFHRWAGTNYNRRAPAQSLQYVKAFNGTIIQIPDDKTIGTYGLMNEGVRKYSWVARANPIWPEIQVSEIPNWPNILNLKFILLASHLPGVLTMW